MSIVSVCFSVFQCLFLVSFLTFLPNLIGQLLKVCGLFTFFLLWKAALPCMLWPGPSVCGLVCCLWPTLVTVLCGWFSTRSCSCPELQQHTAVSHTLLWGLGSTSSTLLCSLRSAPLTLFCSLRPASSTLLCNLRPASFTQVCNLRAVSSTLPYSTNPASSKPLVKPPAFSSIMSLIIESCFISLCGPTG